MGVPFPAGGFLAGERAGPDTRRFFHMTRSLRRAGRWALLVAFLGLLAGAPVISTTGKAWARPYPIEPGPEPTNGDPTGDDRPSPTPKRVNGAPSLRESGRLAVRHGKVISVPLEAWSWVLRYLMAISLR